MGSEIGKILTEQFQQIRSEDPNGNRVEKQGQSSTTKGKRKAGPAKLLEPIKKRTTIGDESEMEEDGYLSIHADETEEECLDEDPDSELRNILQAGTSEDEKEKSENEEDDPLDTLIDDFKLEDKCQGKISQKLADAVNSVWTQKLSKEKMKERLEKHYRPENCESLIVQKVNTELFGVLPKQARSRDIKFQKLQNYNLKSAVPIVQQLDALMKIKPGEAMTTKSLNNLKNLATDALGMMSCSNLNILQIRRDTLAPQLSFSYKHLKNGVPTNSKKLFGDDLKGRLSAIKAGNKASKGAFNNDLRTKLSRQNYSKNWRGGPKRSRFAFDQRPQKRSDYNSRYNNNNNNYNNKKN